jgi:prepilin-type N-terminal cleavage/methylation domain-containing protein
MRRRDEAGLTLPELVVSVAIAGIISVAMGSAMFVGLRTTRDTRTSLSQSNTEQIVTTYVAKDIQASDTAPTATTNPSCGGAVALQTTTRTDALAAANVTVTYRLAGTDPIRQVCGPNASSRAIAHNVTAFGVTDLGSNAYRVAVSTSPSSEVATYSFSFDVRRRQA